jgi:hypothetical protein
VPVQRRRPLRGQAYLRTWQNGYASAFQAVPSEFDPPCPLQFPLFQENNNTRVCHAGACPRSPSLVSGSDFRQTLHVSRYPSGKGSRCKRDDRRSDSGPRLQVIRSRPDGTGNGFLIRPTCVRFTPRARSKRARPRGLMEGRITTDYVYAGSSPAEDTINYRLNSLCPCGSRQHPPTVFDQVRVLAERPRREVDIVLTSAHNACNLGATPAPQPTLRA